MSDVSYAEIMFNIVESLNPMCSSFQETQHEERDSFFSHSTFDTFPCFWITILTNITYINFASPHFTSNIIEGSNTRAYRLQYKVTFT